MGEGPDQAPGGGGGVNWHRPPVPTTGIDPMQLLVEIINIHFTKYMQ